MELVDELDINNKKSIIVLDNSTEHNNELVFEVVSKHVTSRLLFIPQGISSFNAIEYLFCTLKHKQRKIEIKRLSKLKEVIKKLIDELSIEEMRVIRKRWLKEIKREDIVLKHIKLVGDSCKKIL